MNSRAQEISAALANVEDRVTRAAAKAGRSRSELTLSGHEDISSKRCSDFG